jgi:hypothetical protein
MGRLVEAYDAGDHGPFIFVSPLAGDAVLVYQQHENMKVEADESDFLELERQRFITLTLQSSSSITGKLTQRGIDAAHSLFCSGRGGQRTGSKLNTLNHAATSNSR